MENLPTIEARSAIVTNKNVKKEETNKKIEVQEQSLYFDPPVIFVHSKDEPITPDVVQKFIDLHQAEIPRYEYLYDLYLGKHEILNKKEKDAWKPDIRTVVNFSKYLTDSFNGYFCGIPPKFSHPDQNVNTALIDFVKRNEFDDLVYEISKMCDIFGRSYALVYQNESVETCVTYNSPLDMFIVYDDTVKQEPLFAVQYSVVEKGYEGTLYTIENNYSISSANGQIVLTEIDSFYEGFLQVVEFYSNEERTALYEPIITLNNAYNKGLSEKGNNVDYFSDAYLAVIGARLEKEGVESIRDNRIINLYNALGGENREPIDVKFLEKPSNDAAEENFLDRIERLIFMITMVANINDDTFGSKTSGEALMYKLLNESNLAMTKERKFKSSLNLIFKIFFSVPLNFENHTENLAKLWYDIDYTFTRNMPKKLKEEAEVMQLLDGNVSDETKLSVLSIITDPSQELEKMKREDENERPIADYFKTNLDTDDIEEETINDEVVNRE